MKSYCTGEGPWDFHLQIYLQVKLVGQCSPQEVKHRPECFWEQNNIDNVKITEVGRSCSGSLRKKLAIRRLAFTSSAGLQHGTTPSRGLRFHLAISNVCNMSQGVARGTGWSAINSTATIWASWALHFRPSNTFRAPGSKWMSFWYFGSVRRKPRSFCEATSKL